MKYLNSGLICLAIAGGFCATRLAWSATSDVKGSPGVAINSYSTANGTFILWADGHVSNAASGVSISAARADTGWPNNGFTPSLPPSTPAGGVQGAKNVAVGLIPDASGTYVLYADGTVRNPSTPANSPLSSGPWSRTGANVTLTNSTDSLGVGVSSPSTRLDMRGFFRFSDNIGGSVSPTNGEEGGRLFARSGPGTNWGGNQGILTISDGNGGANDEICIMPNTAGSPATGYQGHLSLNADQIRILNADYGPGGGSVPTSRIGGTNGLWVNKGLVGIRNNSPTYPLDIVGDTHINGNLRMTGGNIYGTLATPSDLRLKTNVHPLEHTLHKLDKIRGVAYDMNKVPSIGVIAQELETVYPELVTRTGGKPNYRAVNYSGLSAVLLDAVKDLKAENQALRAREDRLERRLAALEKQR